MFGAGWRGRVNDGTLVSAFVIVSIIIVPVLKALLARIAARNIGTISHYLVWIVIDIGADCRDFWWLITHIFAETSARGNTTIVYSCIVVPVVETISSHIAATNDGAITPIFVGIFAHRCTGDRKSVV